MAHWRMRQTDHRPFEKPRAGFSVIEVLFALVLVSIGLLGMAGSSALAVRSVAFAAREHHATRIAGARLARLIAAGCSAAQSGAVRDDATGVEERWTVDPPRNGAATVQVHAEWPEGVRRRALTLHGGLLC
jgi:prepilin-type N-terminal cleavage/methylation domain-containing protein